MAADQPAGVHKSDCCHMNHTSDAASPLAQLTRRGFLGGLGGVAAIGGAALIASSQAQAANTSTEAVKTSLLASKPLRVKPVLVYDIPQRVEKTSWRHYGGLKSPDDVKKELGAIDGELKKLTGKAEFAIELQPLTTITSDSDAATAAKADCDVIVIYAAGGAQKWLEMLGASNKPVILFVRHKSGPVYFWYETAHWWLLRKLNDTITEPNIGIDDIVVDSYDEVLWRLRALSGLKNARGTKSIAIGGLQAYSTPGQQLGPKHVKETWGYEIIQVTDAELKQRIDKARSDAAVMNEIQRLADELLSQPGVTLGTEKKFVVNTYLAINVFKDIMNASGAMNLGVANCMGSLIGLLDTPPCLVLSLLNDEGYTAFCHTDYTHTPPGVLLRWVSGKPSFICNSHFPHDGMITLAHCAAPRRMNGKDFEPAKIVTHFESDYGAATQVEYRRGQEITCIIPNVNCTKWFGYRGKIADVPNYDMCRSQMDVAIDGDWKKLLRDMQGFHTVVCYGDYLREIGYALKKVGIEWENVSEPA